MSDRPSPPYRTGRYVTGTDVDGAADALLRAGERPTVEKIRQHLGTGSPNTINPLLDAWWKRLASRLDSGPHALHRLPESVAQITETLWLTALEEARTRAGQEQRRKTNDLERDRRETDLRRHLLSLRESEFEERLKERSRTISMLEEQLSALTRLLQQEQATRASAERRIATLEASLQQSDARVQTLIAGLAADKTIPTRRGKPRAAKTTPRTTKRPRPPSIQRGSRKTRSARKSGKSGTRRSTRPKRR
ncbi:MAG: DNA-binding protein [Dehalococcoidia bacterium]